MRSHKDCQRTPSGIRGIIITVPELNGLLKEHKIVLNGHNNRKDFVHLTKQRGVLLPEYVIARRRVRLDAGRAGEFMSAAPCMVKLNADRTS